MHRLRACLARLAQLLVFVAFVRPLLVLVMGLAVRHRERLPARGPALVIANHNSHLDTLVLMAVMPLAILRQVRPVAAADHFACGLRGWIARALLHAILIERHGGLQALDPVLHALDRGEIVIFFPEGSRGEPGMIAPFRRGIAHLTAARPEVPVIPVYLRNLGMCLPKGAWFLLPFCCELITGRRALLGTIAARDIPAHLRGLVEALGGEASQSVNGPAPKAGHPQAHQGRCASADLAVAPARADTRRRLARSGSALALRVGRASGSTLARDLRALQVWRPARQLARGRSRYR
jgi:1-acyl-sn-glycerol-3-phosphate acyltransferase